MLRVVLDTNILVSATIARGNAFYLLRLAKLGELCIVLSPQILDEFRGVISRPKFGFSQKQVSAIIEQVKVIAQIVEPKIRVNVVKEDPTDNKVLECAEAGNINYVVSGDRHLLDIRTYKNIKIVKSKVMIDIILGVTDGV